MYAERDTATEEFLADIEANVKMIAEHISYLPERDQSFATSLVAGYERYNQFTARQLPYVVKIWQTLNEMGASEL